MSIINWKTSYGWQTRGSGGVFSLNFAMDGITPDVNVLYGPHSSLSDAHTNVVNFLKFKGIAESDTEAQKSIPKSLTVGIVEDGNVNEYWYQDVTDVDTSTTGYTVANLVPKTYTKSQIEDIINNYLVSKGIVQVTPDE